MKEELIRLREKVVQFQHYLSDKGASGTSKITARIFKELLDEEIEKSKDSNIDQIST